MRLTPRVLANITKMLDFYSQFNPSPLSIKQFIDFGKPYGYLYYMITLLNTVNIFSAFFNCRLVACVERESLYRYVFMNGFFLHVQDFTEDRTVFEVRGFRDCYFEMTFHIFSVLMM